MKTAWKMFITDAGLNSYQNETLELRDFYRMIVFLQNNFKGRISEKKIIHRSFLFSLVKMLYANSQNTERNRNQVIEDDDHIRTFYIDGTPIYIGWCTCGGVSITAKEPKGNPKIAEIAGMIEHQDIWWNQ